LELLSRFFKKDLISRCLLYILIQSLLLPSIKEEYNIKIRINKLSVIEFRRAEDDDSSKLSKLKSNIKEFTGIALDDKSYKPESKRIKIFKCKTNYCGYILIIPS